MEEDNKGLTVKLDIKNMDVFQRVLGILQHITETTTCEATQLYIIEQFNDLMIDLEASNNET